MTTPSQFYGQNKVKIPQPGADEKHKGTQPTRGCVKFAKKSLKMSENEAKQYWLTNLLKNRFWIKFVFLNFMRILKSEYANFFTELFPKIQRI